MTTYVEPSAMAMTAEEHIPSIAMYASSTFSSPEPETRGRKRRRSPMRLALATATGGGGAGSNSRQQQLPSGESATLRGRQRYRSTSVLNFTSRAPSLDAAASRSPRRLLRGGFTHRRRRSQSPSRSCSADGGGKDLPKRRRQRTRSRSRSHHDYVGGGGGGGGGAGFAAVELKSPLQFEFVVPFGGREEEVQGKEVGG